MARSLAAGRRVTLDDVGLFSDGTAVRRSASNLRPVPAFCRRGHHRRHRCAVRGDQGRLPGHAHPARAGRRAGVAGCKQYVEREGLRGHNLVAITCGANMNFDRLRFVAERAEVGEQREALFAVTLPEERGSFKRFCELLGTRNVTEFNYRIATRTAHIFVGLQVDGRDDADQLVARPIGRRLRNAGPDRRRTGQAAPAPHGGRALRLAVDERVFRFEFPERPGALMRFLRPCTRLEHLAVPLPQPGFRLRPHPRRPAGAAPGRGGTAAFRGRTGLRAPGRNRQQRLSAVPGLTHPRPYRAPGLTLQLMARASAKATAAAMPPIDMVCKAERIGSAPVKRALT